MSNVDASHITSGPSFGRILRLLRTESGWSLRKAEAMTGISYTRLCNLEHNKSSAHLSLDELCRLAAAYGREISL